MRLSPLGISTSAVGIGVAAIEKLAGLCQKVLSKSRSGALPYLCLVSAVRGAAGSGGPRYKRPALGWNLTVSGWTGTVDKSGRCEWLEIRSEIARK